MTACHELSPLFFVEFLPATKHRRRNADGTVKVPGKMQRIVVAHLPRDAGDGFIRFH
ncbi:hypothetical protein SODG_000713 [Sodalis praecaptivus]|nr:hypothetical protein NVIRENTERO_02010 [Sodalis praecaptivus]